MVTEIHRMPFLEQIDSQCVLCAAMSTFSPVSSRSSDGIRMCVYVCVCVCVCGRNELQVCTMLAYPHISSFRTMSVRYTSTRTDTSSNHLRITNLRGKKWILPYVLALSSYREIQWVLCWRRLTTDVYNVTLTATMYTVLAASFYLDSVGKKINN